MYTKNFYKNNSLKNKKKEKAPTWLVTFSDLITLMLTFFVLLLTYANINLEKFKNLVESVQESFTGFNPSATTSKRNINLETFDFRKKQKEKSIFDHYVKDNQMDFELDRMLVNIMKFINDNNLSNEVYIRKGKRSIRLKVPEYLLFSAGNAQLKKEVFPLLNMIFDLLLEARYFLIVEGYSDNTPIKSEIYPSNWELSGARAASVVRYLHTRGIPQEHLSATGYASNFPIYPNDSPENRKKNRRVELIITNISPRTMLE